MNKLILKPGREKSLRRRHPWIFSGAVARVDGRPAPGETVVIRASGGQFLAVAAYSPDSQITARVWAWREQTIDPAFIRARIERAARRRQPLLDGGATDAVRLVHGESDGLPGVVADRFDDTVVMQLNSAGAEFWREAIADALIALPGVARVWERSDADVRSLEGLAPRSGLVCGKPLIGSVLVREHGLQYRVELEAGHKTGFYLDQRDNRLLARGLSAGREVLDCFCYSGGFALNAAAGGAKSVLAIDSAAPALAAARSNAALNGAETVHFEEGDVFSVLREFRNAGRFFDFIVLDPPKFAPTAAHAERAARAYKDINLLAFKLLRPDGLLMTCSCSGGVSADLFQKIVAGAALDAGVDAHIMAWLHAAPDHPVALNFPESEYLKGLLCRVAS